MQIVCDDTPYQISFLIVCVIVRHISCWSDSTFYKDDTLADLTGHDKWAGMPSAQTPDSWEPTVAVSIVITASIT